MVLHDETIPITQTSGGPLKLLARKTVIVGEHNLVLSIMSYTTIWRRFGGNSAIEGQSKMGKGVARGVGLYRLFISCVCRKLISYNLSI